ncbi:MULTISPECIES: thioesterase family protein [unclassified Streptomyces]|uniref:thioesterase family protein n=1 Tax=unclassified Streptomyces TaxID=2593676 RepID=UPI0003641AF3|nr:MULTISPECIES: thioesterase family protein [unclassified Streptomyces]MYT29271.1 thioesterase [Streptomyces sp. SID8354]
MSADVEMPRRIEVGRPRYAGANIRTWIGFKHFMQLAEEAVLEWFRVQGQPPGRLYHEHGLGLEIIDSSALLPAVLDVDDAVTAEVAPLRPGRFSVRLRAERPEGHSTVLRGKVGIALVTEKEAPGDAAPPAGLHAPVVPEVRPDPGAEPLPLDRVTPEEALRLTYGCDALVRDWRAAYYHCHYSDRLQHSAYVRELEETVDAFLAGRGLGVPKLLAERAWIPVVSRARVRMLADVRMDETLYTVFRVEDVLRETTYNGRMDCWVRRGDSLVQTATAHIQHGYAVSRGPDSGTLARLCPATVAALTGGAA